MPGSVRTDTVTLWDTPLVSQRVAGCGENAPTFGHQECQKCSVLCECGSSVRAKDTHRRHRGRALGFPYTGTKLNVPNVLANNILNEWDSTFSHKSLHDGPITSK